MEKVEAFRTKLEDVGAMPGIMVSPHGFQEGAIKTAQAYNIELFTLTEVKSDWTIVLVKLLRNGICFIRSIATRRPIERGGKLFLTDARRILQDVDKAKLRAERIAQRKAGTLRIDIATAVSWHVLVVDSFANCGVGSQRWRWSCSICFVLDLRMLRCQRT
jgi:hypothetical protein